MRGPACIVWAEHDALACASQGYLHVLGDVYSNDFDFRGERGYHRAYVQRTANDGSILIMHAAHGGILTDTVRLLHELLPVRPRPGRARTRPVQ